jgi:hypothetical protein
MIFERAQGVIRNVASLVERKTRFAVLFRNNDRSTTHPDEPADERGWNPPQLAQIDHV